VRAIGLGKPLLAGGGKGKRIGTAISRIGRALNQTLIDQFGYERNQVRLLDRQRLADLLLLEPWVFVNDSSTA
jgi:hypothetical protein